jgi:urea transport system substrate-binding protein
VGWVQGLSGIGSAWADSAQQGIETALEEINATNAAGRKFVLITADDATDPRTAIDVCNRLVLQDKVDVVIGLESTPARLACNQIVLKAGLPYVAAASGLPDHCLSNLFATGPMANQMVEPLLDYMFRNGVKSVYLYGSDYSGAKALTALAKKFIAAKGGNVAGESYAAFGTPDFAADIGKIAGSNADAVAFALAGVDQVTFHRQFSNDPRMAKIRRADFFPFEAIAKGLGPAAKDVLTVSPFLASLDDPATKAFTAAVRKKYGDKAKIDVPSYLSYIGLHLIADAVKKAGSGGSGVIKSLETASFDAPGGRISILRHNAVATIYVGRGKEDGTVEVIEKTPTPVEPMLNCSF